MRYLQAVATGILAALCVIAFQLRGMLPVRYGEIEKLMQAGNNDAAFKKLQNIPIVQMYSLGGKSMEVHGSVRIEGKVNADVSNGWVDDQGNFHSSPLDVRIVK